MYLKCVFVTFMLVCTFTMACDEAEQKSAKQDSVLPSFSLGTMDGAKIDFTSFSGSVLVVDFWATWCKPCIHEIPGYNNLNEKYRDQNFNFVGITMSSGEVSNVTAFAERNDIRYPIYMGTPKAAMAVGGVEGFPKTFVFDQQGNIVKSFLGIHPDKIPEIDKIVGKLLEKGKVGS